MGQHKSTFLTNAKRFFEPAFFYPKSFFAGILQVTMWPFYGIVTTLVLARAVTHLQNPNREMFFSTLLRFGIFVVVYQLINFLLRNGAQKYSWKAYSYLFRKYLDRYVRLDNNKTEAIGTGKMLSIIDKGVEQTIELNIQTIALGTATIIQVAFVTYILTNVIRYAPLLLYIFLVATLIISYYLTKGGNVRRRKRDDGRDEGIRHIVKVLMSKFEILLNNKIDTENAYFDKLSKEIAYNDRQKQLYEHLGFNVPTVMLAIITISLFLFLGYRFFYMNSISYAEIVLYLGLVNSLESGTRSAIDLYKAYAKNFQRITRLRNTFDEIPDMHGYDKGKKFQFKNGDIEFHDVSFSYTGMSVVEGMSFSIEGGKKTALVGISGGGKSTILKLIAGYLHTTKGHITVDGQILPTNTNLGKAISLKSYYNSIGYLTQDPSVFDGTIYDNLTYALDHVPTTQELDNAIQQSQCQFIYDFTDKMKTEIGERGVRLSGGQKQRLAIAKIFLKNPEIVLLDEPTSALDSLSEESITKAMHNLFEGRTVIVIAHRLQTVKQADDIIVIEGGKVIERGTHHQLVKNDGHYAKMLELQSGF